MFVNLKHINLAEIKLFITNLLKICDILGAVRAVVLRVPLKWIVFKQINRFFVECAPVVLERAG